ncbi:hypothetical protein BGZ93_010009 [Podila epicladia]|nr:hypothetical protein BGZ93_010009 [Podila epicladia]KAG0092851.1 hypothetical protein BGZ92_008416 [Podila epicladia]
MNQQNTNSSQEDPMAMLMGQLQSLNLDSTPNNLSPENAHFMEPRSSLVSHYIETLNLHSNNNRNTHLTFSNDADGVMKQQACIQYQLEWDAFLQNIKHVDSLKLQLPAQKARLSMKDYNFVLLRYYAASFNTRPEFFQKPTIDACNWMRSTFGQDGWELIHLNTLRIIDDGIAISESLPFSSMDMRAELIQWREDEVTSRRKARERASRHAMERSQYSKTPGSCGRLVVSKREYRLADEEHRRIEEERRWFEEERRKFDGVVWRYE